MKKFSVPLLMAGLLVLAWGAADFLNLFTVWQEAFQHYAGTGAEAGVLDLGRVTLAQGLSKAGIGALMVGTAAYQLRRAKETG